MWRAALELVGAGKKSILFEEAFAMRLVRLFQRPVEEHPFILASKSGEARRQRSTFHAAIAVAQAPPQAEAKQTIAATVTLTNTGTATWLADAAPGAGHVRVGIQLLDADGRVISRDFARSALAADVRPGASHTMQVSFPAPADGGDYHLKFDLVAEGVTWFEPAGTKAVVLPLRVVKPRQ